MSEDEMDEMAQAIAQIQNPPGYGETIGCVVLYEPTPNVVYATAAALWDAARKDLGLAPLSFAATSLTQPTWTDHYKRLAHAAIVAAAHASGGSHAR